jgi:adenine phosphoribosyltransferase
VTDLAALVRDVPDWPKPGILFKDVTPLLADPSGLAAAVEALADPWAGRVDKVVGIEARGFILAAPVALALRAGFVPIRKAGKLPWHTAGASYALEYGEATIEMHTDAVAAGDQVLVVDDVLATGGTAAAAVRLVTGCGATVVGVSVLLELGALAGRAALPGLSVSSLLVV